MESLMENINKYLTDLSIPETTSSLNDIYEFANLRSTRTGINKIVVHAYCQGDKEAPHGPRIKVSNFYEKYRRNDCFIINVLTLKVEEGVVKITPKEFNDVVKWIKLNKKLLIEFWESKGEMDIDDFLNRIKKI